MSDLEGAVLYNQYPLKVARSIVTHGIAFNLKCENGIRQLVGKRQTEL